MIKPKQPYSLLINESQIVDKWSPKLKSQYGVMDDEKLRWMSLYAHFHQISENLYATPGNTLGMGAVKLPGQPTSQGGFQGQTPGSGDKILSYFPLAMQVAGQTIGLDLLPVVPMQGPVGILNYVDFVYAGGRGVNSSDIGVKSIPFLIELPITGRDLAGATNTGILLSATTPATVHIRNTGSTGNYIRAKYIANSRINGYAIFALVGIYSNTNALLSRPDDNNPAAPTVASVIDGSTTLDIVEINPTTLATIRTVVTPTAMLAQYTKALENVIPGFSSDSDTNWMLPSPYERDKGEVTPTRSLALKVYNKSVAAKTVQCDIQLTREQIQDSRQFGIDILAQANALLANELSQTINANILQRLFAIGATNHVNVMKTENTDFHVNFRSTPLTFAQIDTEFSRFNNKGQRNETIQFNGTSSYSQIDPVALTGGETLYTVQRRLQGALLAGKNMINIRSRAGAANAIVSNGHVTTVLQDIAGFQTAPMMNNTSQDSVYNAGSVAGLQIFVDPNMRWEDTRISMLRRGDMTNRGLVFMPYLLAESVDTIAEGTMAPKIQVKSRYDIVEAGQNPEVHYLTMYIAHDGNLYR